MSTKSYTAKERKEKERFAKVIGKRLREARVQAGLSQEELADKAGFHRTYVGFMEQGVHAPNLYSLSKITEALGIKIRDITQDL